MEDLDYLHQYYEKNRYEERDSEVRPSKIVLFSNDLEILNELRQCFFKTYSVPILHFSFEDLERRGFLEREVLLNSIIIFDCNGPSPFPLYELIEDLESKNILKKCIFIQGNSKNFVKKNGHFLIKEKNGIVRIIKICKHLLKLEFNDNFQYNHISNFFDIPELGIDFKKLMNQIEIHFIEQALGRTNGNKKKASALLKLNRTTLIEKMKKLGLL